ncbi:MAG: 50S ribosomal protein L17 [Bacteroides sp.]|nr:50S ribosomal protein L17 [Bacteroides sp.]
MRHNKKFNHLSRKKGHREALLSNLAISLIMHKRIFTTLAKAKALRMYAEPLITRCKKDDMNNRRLVFSYLQNKEAIKELFGVVAEKVADRPGGYTRILKTGHRLGDNAEMAMIELVDFNENMLGEKAPKAKTRRSRRGAKKADAPAVEAAEAPAAEAPAAE